MILGVNSSFDLHDIASLPTISEKCLQIREERTLNIFESMDLMYIRIEKENGLTAAFQTRKIHKVQTSLGNVMVDFLLKDNDTHPEIQSKSILLVL